MKATCGPEAICRLIYKYPDLGPILDVPTPAPTKAPTLNPTQETPPPFVGVWDCNLANGPGSKAQRKSLCVSHKDNCKWNNKKGKCFPLS